MRIAISPGRDKKGRFRRIFLRFSPFFWHNMPIIDIFVFMRFVTKMSQMSLNGLEKGIVFLYNIQG